MFQAFFTIFIVCSRKFVFFWNEKDLCECQLNFPFFFSYFIRRSLHFLVNICTRRLDWRKSWLAANMVGWSLRMMQKDHISYKGSWWDSDQQYYQHIDPVFTQIIITMVTWKQENWKQNFSPNLLTSHFQCKVHQQ